MILDLVYYPDPILQKSTKPIDEITDEIRELADNMLETMYLKQGIGLAAPQVGVNKRICVIDISEGRKDPMVLINPQVLHREGTEENEEGCLSFPGIYGKVERPSTITVRFTDREGVERTMEKVEPFLSIVMQHEIDHLDGILFIHLMSATELLKIKKTLKKMKEDQKNKSKA